MSNRDYVYRNPRPVIAVESTGGASLGNCYSVSFFKVTSTQALSMQKLQHLFLVGVLGVGQTFSARRVTAAGTLERVQEVLGWQDKVEPTGHDAVECTAVDRNTQKAVNEPATNPYTGKPYAPIQAPYYVYECETRCDSGD